MRLAGILLSPACQQIDFWLGGLHVSGAELARVARAICSTNPHIQTVKIELGTEALAQIGEDTAAGYRALANTLVLEHENWGTSDPFERIGVVHESVHILRDSYGHSLTYLGKKHRPRAATDEAVAYVAGCLFNVYEQRSVGGQAVKDPVWLATRKSPIHAVAYEVALRQADKRAGSAVDREDLSRLFKTWVAYQPIRTGNPAPRFRERDGIALPNINRR
jgi:hypothetical protein